MNAVRDDDGDDYFRALCRPRIACCARVKYLPDYFIVEKTRVECISPEGLGIQPDVFGKLPHAALLLPFGIIKEKKNSITSMSWTIMILCEMSPHLAVGEISIPSETCQTKFQSNLIEETFLPIRKSMRKRANLIERAKGEVGAITHRI